MAEPDKLKGLDGHVKPFLREYDCKDLYFVTKKYSNQILRIQTEKY